MRRLSEHVKMEPCTEVDNRNLLKKSFHLSCDDLRKDKSKSDTLKALFLEGKQLLSESFG